MSEILTLNRAARRLGVPAYWLKSAAVAGHVPCIRAGNKLVFELGSATDALAEMIRSRGMAQATVNEPAHAA